MMPIEKENIRNALVAFVKGDTVLEQATEAVASLADEKATSLELYKLEYEKTAERYENIYKAIWTNFSYMSVIAGAILTFGSNFYPNATLVSFMACLPLLFWYFVTFVPMNRYGYRAATRLEEIEGLLKNNYGADLKHYTYFNDKKRRWRSVVLPRVGPAMFVVFSLLTSLALLLGIKFFSTDSQLFQANEINVIPSLISRLSVPASQPSEDQTDEISNLRVATETDIRRRLSDSTKKQIQDYSPSNPLPSKEFQLNIATDFNKIIEGPPLYDAKRDNSRILGDPAGIKDLYSNAASPEDVVRANRAFLERLFPAEVQRQAPLLFGSGKSYPDQLFRWLLWIFVFLIVGYWFYELFVQFFIPAGSVLLFKIRNRPSYPGSISKAVSGVSRWISQCFEAFATWVEEKSAPHSEIAEG